MRSNETRLQIKHNLIKGSKKVWKVQMKLSNNNLSHTKTPKSECDLQKGRDENRHERGATKLLIDVNNGQPMSIKRHVIKSEPSLS